MTNKFEAEVEAEKKAFQQADQSSTQAAGGTSSGQDSGYDSQSDGDSGSLDNAIYEKKAHLVLVPHIIIWKVDSTPAVVDSALT